MKVARMAIERSSTTVGPFELYSHQNGTHIQAAMDKLQARFKLAS